MCILTRKRIGLTLFLACIFFSISTHALMLPITFEEHTLKAHTIVVATPISVKSSLVDLGNKVWDIDTQTTFHIDEIIKGDALDSLSFVLPGGTVAARTVRVEHVPSFIEGKPVFLFLRKTEEGYLPLYGEAGTFNISNDQVVKEGISKSKFIEKINDTIQNSKLGSQNLVSDTNNKSWFSGGCSLRN